MSSDLVFIGGMGRSGTHVLARLLGRHPRFAEVPIEARFHCDTRGMPDLLGGRVTLASFLERLRDFWWHRVRGGRPAARPLQPLDPQGVRRRRGALRGRLCIRPGAGLPAALRGPALAAGGAGGKAGFGGDELAQRQGGAGPAPAVRRGALRAHRARRARRRPLRDRQGLGARHRPGGDRLVGGRAAGDRGGSARGGGRRGLRAVRLRALAWWCSTTSSGEIARSRTSACSTSSGSTTTPAWRSSSSSGCTPAAARVEPWREGLGRFERRRVERKYEAALAELEREGNHVARPLIDAYERLG